MPDRYASVLMTLINPNSVFKVTAFLKSNIPKTVRPGYYCRLITLNGTMFGDLD